MAGFGDAVKYLYTQFILRDVLSFITPGAIVVLTTTYMLDSKIFHRYIPWPFYIPLFGLFYIVGFAIQCLGEISYLVRTQNLAQSSLCYRLLAFWCHWDKKENYKRIIWWCKVHKKSAEFLKITQYKEWAQQQHERLVVLKQMCGNGFLALAIAGVLSIARYFSNISSYFNNVSSSEQQRLPLPFVIISIVFGVLLLFSLLWGHRIHVLRQITMDDAILDTLKNSKQES